MKKTDTRSSQYCSYNLPANLKFYQNKELSKNELYLCPTNKWTCVPVTAGASSCLKHLATKAAKEAGTVTWGEN